MSTHIHEYQYGKYVSLCGSEGESAPWQQATCLDCQRIFAENNRIAGQEEALIQATKDPWGYWGRNDPFLPENKINKRLI